MDKSEHAKLHWDNVYTSKPANLFSWYQAHLRTSLGLIERTGAGRSSAIIDVGGGESTLVDDLLSECFGNITVLAISAKDGWRTLAPEF